MIKGNMVEKSAQRRSCSSADASAEGNVKTLRVRARVISGPLCFCFVGSALHSGVVFGHARR